MTKADSTPALPLAKAKRQYKVKEGYHSYQLKTPVRERTSVGEICLKGHWLVQAGFVVDQPVIVRIMQGCLVLTVE